MTATSKNRARIQTAMIQATWGNDSPMSEMSQQLIEDEANEITRMTAWEAMLSDFED